MNDDKVDLLAKKLLDGTITDTERTELEEWYASFEDSEIEISSYSTEKDLKQKIYGQISKGMAGIKPYRLWRRIARIAAVLVILSSTAYLVLKNDFKSHQSTAKIKPDVMPGSNKAYLTLSDGTKINLTESNAKQLSNIAGLEIIRKANGQLLYKLAQSNNVGSKDIHTISTPTGGQYQIQLTDGTNVWLNASSSISFPVSFSSNERKVNLTGEGYFEVAHEKKRPFKVQSENQIIEVLGTHFNVSAYPDETMIRTTLLQGKVIVSTPTNDLTLSVGQQSLVSKQSMISSKKVDVEEAIDWKNGEFIYNNEALESIMRKLSRWYNVEIIYQGGNKNLEFWGSVSRYDNLSKVLDKLELAGGVHFKIEGNQVYVLK